MKKLVFLLLKQRYRHTQTHAATDCSVLNMFWCVTNELPLKRLTLLTDELQTVVQINDSDHHFWLIMFLCFWLLTWQHFLLVSSFVSFPLVIQIPDPSSSRPSSCLIELLLLFFSSFLILSYLVSPLFFCFIQNVFSHFSLNVFFSQILT